MAASTPGALKRRWATLVRESAEDGAARAGIGGSIARDVAAALDVANAVTDLVGIGMVDTAARLVARHRLAGWSTAAAPAADAIPADAAAAFERTIARAGTPRARGDLLAFVEDARARLALPAPGWLIAYAILFRRAEIRAASVAKRAAADAVLRDAALWADIAGSADLLLAAAIETGEAARIEAALGRILPALGRKRDAARRALIEVDGLLALGRYEEARSRAASLWSPADAAFAEAVRGRRVAVVGPAVNALGSGPDIDAHDLVVRLNFIDTAGFRASAAMLGMRTDASYYNSKMMAQRGPEILATLAGHPGLVAAFRSRRYARRAAGIMPPGRVRAYSLAHVFFGRGYAMKHALRDLMLLPTGRVTVYGADFFLSPETHFKDYVPSKTNQLRSYITHHAIDTWRFMRAGHRAGLFSADAVLAGLLEREEDDFADLLAERLRAHGGRRSAPEAAPRFRDG